ncbi:hypothetical protein [Lentibacillus saliphilus]|uniref:hypothetical protein n=1 Tax=Lentibacillus saliphilus TaxID=2737028 RepID=UPI001C2FFBE4|nr:hypothetical protein [Lentibacillus saliphilus]
MVNKGRNRIIITALTALLIVSLAFSGIQYFNRLSKQEVEDREELLEAVMWKITEEDTIPKEDIEEIIVLKAKAGVYPLNFDVAINMKNGEQILYSWTDKNKTDVKQY